ncbi:Alpha-mannosyltransferase [Kalmanozyma brasiliensis GHG001]|uniref:Uncharacterized protein n=1 Tax=Kalmanozyma brasiliensis (strain GHG001) TaxID=1365824 RepID=V5EY02_KALBG|nr:Alpha-mannosyltransferase [Kalmanozyma brasiliensis GHG001]EST08508.1 Alpha-mannosyltransferase [Kalmanozyma brasiliensis GHG001]
MTSSQASSPPSYASSADEEFSYEARPSTSRRPDARHLNLPLDTASYARPEPPSNAAFIQHRNATTPTTPSFNLASNGIFHSREQSIDPAPMSHGGWSRSKSSQARDVKHRPSLYTHGRMLSNDAATNGISLHSNGHGHHDEKAAWSTGSRWPSLRYLLYTRKGRREIPDKVRACASNRSIIAMVLGLLVIAGLFFGPSAPVERGVNGRIIPKQRAAEAVFLNHWIEHVIHHPVRARDKTGFAEMGLRTEMYSHLLRHPTLPNFERMERALWPFVPGINQLRSWWQASVQAKVLQYDSAPSPNDDLEEYDSPLPTERLLPRAFRRDSEYGIVRGSRGIVMSLGWKGAVFASQFISIIRDKHRNDIPIELYYYGDSDLPSKYRDYLTKAHRNVRCIDLESLGLFDPDLTQLNRQGFAIKPFAMLATNFTEVILADADAILLEDPDRFFEEPGYIDSGTLFFHDRDHQRKGADYVVNEFMTNQLSQRGPSPRLASSEFWKKKGIFEQESGIVVLDKRKTDVFAALLFTCWQNMGEIRKKTTYRVFWGDKETFWLAFEFSNFPYYFVPRYAQAIGTVKKVSRQEKVEKVAAAKAKQEMIKGVEAAKDKAAKVEVYPEDQEDVANVETEEDVAKEAGKDVAKDGKKDIVLFDDDGNAVPAGDAKDDPFQEGAGNVLGEQGGAEKDLQAKEEQLAATAAASIHDLEDEEFCSEHPLHFLGADVDENGGDNLVKDPLLLGRPAWFNGGILADKTKAGNEPVYISPNAFTVDGAWEFLFESEQWCIRNYTKGNLDQFGLTARIEELGKVAEKAEAAFRSVIPKPQKKKKKGKAAQHD